MPEGHYTSEHPLSTPPLKERTMHDIETLITHFLNVSWGPVIPPGEALGANEAAKGNTLLNYCGIGRELIEFTVDRSPHKQGTLLPGSRIPVREPSALLAKRPDYALILAWNWAEEIIAQQREYLERGGTFIIPVPGPRLVGGDGPGRAALTR